MNSILGDDCSNYALTKSTKVVPQGIGGGGYDFGRSSVYKLNEEKSRQSFRKDANATDREQPRSCSRETVRNATSR